MTDADEWTDQVDSSDASGGAASDETPSLYYPDLDTFVREYLAHAYARYLTSNRIWCPEWDRHPEAVARLDALWRAWEHLRLDPALGISTWYRDHADHHMTVLMDPHGPLKGCTAARGHQPSTRALATT